MEEADREKRSPFLHAGGQLERRVNALLQKVKEIELEWEGKEGGREGRNKWGQWGFLPTNMEIFPQLRGFFPSHGQFSLHTYGEFSLLMGSFPYLWGIFPHLLGFSSAYEDFSPLTDICLHLRIFVPTYGYLSPLTDICPPLHVVDSMKIH